MNGRSTSSYYMLVVTECQSTRHLPHRTDYLASWRPGQGELDCNRFAVARGVAAVKGGASAPDCERCREGSALAEKRT
jgi:hypothetical protein